MEKRTSWWARVAWWARRVRQLARTPLGAFPAQAERRPGERRPRLERAFARLLDSQCQLRDSTSSLEGSVQLDAIVVAQLEHLDELIGQVAGHLRQDRPLVVSLPAHPLGVALILAHATITEQLQELVALCGTSGARDQAAFARSLSFEHQTLAAGVARLVVREAARKTRVGGHA